MDAALRCPWCCCRSARDGERQGRAESIAEAECFKRVSQTRVAEQLQDDVHVATAMAATAFPRNGGQQTIGNASRSRDDRAPKRRKEQRSDIWSNLLRQTREAQARSRTQAVQHRELLVCGGSPDDQRAFVQSLARPRPPAPPSRNRDQRAAQKPKGEVRLSNRYAYGYGHMMLYSPPQQTTGMLGAEAEEVGRVEVHTLPEPEGAFELTLRRLLDAGKKGKEGSGVDADEGFASGATQKEESRRPAVALLLSWKEPWRFLSLLRRWLQLLARALLADGSPDEDPFEVLKEYKLSVTVVVQHVEAQEGLEREGYREESFDYISQCLRTCLLPLSAALVYTSSNPPPQQPGSALSEPQKVLYTSLQLDLGPLSPAPAKGTTSTKRDDLAPKHNVVDRMAIIVPSGWDSVGKIRLLSETFSPEAVLEAWTTDLDTPLQPTPQPSQPETPAEEPPKEDQQTNGGAEQHDDQTIYATSPAATSRSPSPSPSNKPPHQQPPLSAITPYELTILNPTAHKTPKPPQIEVTTQPTQLFLASMRAHLQDLAAHDAERAKTNPRGDAGMVSTTAGSLNSSGRVIGLPSGEQTGALDELGDVRFNVGGVSYNAVTAEAAIESLRRRPHAQQQQLGSSAAGGGVEAASSPMSTTGSRTVTPRPPRREEREVSVGTPGTPLVPPPSSGKGDLPVDKLEEYFASLMKKGGGGGSGGSAGSTPSKPH